MSTPGDAVRWLAPELGTPKSVPAPPPLPAAPPGPSVEELAAIERAAREEGHALGHKQGYTAGHMEGYGKGQAEVNRLIAQLGGVLNGFARPLAELDHEVEHALGALAVRIAGSLLGHAYTADPALLEALVHAALEHAGGGDRDAEIHLHPQDLALLKEQLQASTGARLVADATLKRGETRVHTALLRIDGSLDARLNAALAALTRTEDTP